MSIIIRLENLPWSANSADIRHFFDGLDIPDGGVHIIGGERGDAFIAFKNDEDARQAMSKDDLSIKENRVRLFLSSRIELNQFIEMVRNGPIHEESLPAPEKFGSREHYGSPVHISHRKSPERIIRPSDRNIRRRSPGRNIRRKSPERTSRRRSPDRTSRRRSPDRTSRRTSSDRNVRRRSRERDSRRSPDRFRQRSPDASGQHRPRDRSRKSRRSRSPITDKRRSRSLDRQHRFSRNRQAEQQASPTRRNDNDSRSVHLGSISNDMELYSAPREKFQVPENPRVPPELENFQHDAKFMECAPQLYEKPSPKEPFIPPNSWQEPNYPPRVEHFDDPNYRTDGLQRDLRGFEEQPPSHFPPGVQGMKDESLNARWEFENRPPFQRDPMPINDTHTTPYFDNFDRPQFEKQDFYQESMSRDAPRLVNEYKEKPVFSENFPTKPPLFNPPEMSRFSRNEPRFPDQVPRNESRFSDQVPRNEPRFPDQVPRNEPRFPDQVPRNEPRFPDQVPRNEPRFPDQLPRNEPRFPDQLPRNEPRFPDRVPRNEPRFPDRVPRNEPRFPDQQQRNENQNFPRWGLQDMHSDSKPGGGEFELESAKDMNYNFNQNQPGTNTRPLNRLPNYCVQLSGFGPNDSFKDVQSVLKGVYAPQKNIKWDVSNRGCKTGIAYVKISNMEDFNTILGTSVYFLNEKRIGANKCPDEVYWKIFPRDNLDTRYGENCSGDLVYMLKGLPYSVTEADIINFFKGLKFIDLLILYDKDGKATGTGFVEFGNPNDLKRAFERNGKKIGHRYIELLKSSREDIRDAKKTAVSTNKSFQDATPVIPIQGDNFRENFMLHPQMPKKHPLCAFLLGLPTNVRTGQIYDFFSECGIKPHAVHVLLNAMQQPDNMAYVEFLNQFELDAALKQHNCCIGFNPILIRQISYKDMVHALDTNQAIHVFENQPPMKRPMSPVPKKVPYLWDPDDFENSDHNAKKDSGHSDLPAPWLDNSKNFNRNETHRNENKNVQVFDYSHFENKEFPRGINQTQQYGNAAESFQEDMTSYPACFSPASSSPRATSPDFGTNDLALPSTSRTSMGANRHFEIQSSQRTKENPFLSNQSGYEKPFQFSEPSRIQESKFTASYDPEENRVPLKFDMKMRQSVVSSSKASDAFIKTAEEEKMKLGKLSPLAADKKLFKHGNPNDNLNTNIYQEPSSHGKNGETSHINVGSDFKFNLEPNKPKFFEKDFKSVNQKKPLDEKNTLYTTENNAATKKSRVVERKPSFGKGKGSFKGENRGKSTNANFKASPRKEFQGDIFLNPRDSEGFVEFQDESYNPFHSGNIDKFEVVDSSCKSFGKSGSTIQASDVDPSVGLNDLMDFFHSFNLHAEDIIRRFTDFGVPTGDIRIAFSNSQEAERALRTLNYTPLKGTPIKMFIV